MNARELNEQLKAQHGGPVLRPGPRDKGLPLDAVIAAAMGHIRVKTDAEVDAIERKDREVKASDVRGRLPRALRSQSALERLQRACDPKVAAAAREWQPRAGNLLLLGGTGVGKSTAAAFVLRRLLGIGVHRGGAAWELARRVHWFHAIDLQDARQKHPRGSGAIPSEILTACMASVLVIDDAGKDRFPDAVEEVAVSRYDDNLPTIITANLSFPDGLIEHYGEATVRKMAERGGLAPRIVDLTGPP